MNVTLVAYYKAKPTELEAFLLSLNNILQSKFGSSFTPYSTEQVHATIVGLEQMKEGNRFLNSNFLTLRHCRKAMDLRGFVDQLKATLQTPIIIRMGGYTLDTDYGFTSQGQHPMTRSFSIRSDKVVSIGWPVQNDKIGSALVNLRKSFERFNILHKWHRHPEDSDNDFYFVLGHLDRAKTENSFIEFVENKLRNHFSTLSPIDLEISIDSLQFVAYTELTLPTNSSHTLSLSDADADIGNLTKLFNL